MIPSGCDYLGRHIRPKPDLYGPFWISVTLIFSIAISGNMANYLQTAASGNYHWKYDFHVVSLAATTVLCYTWLLPLLLWVLLKWFTTREVSYSFLSLLLYEATVTLLELICVYGYCMSVYVPISVLWIIQINWLQWLLVFLGAALSGSVLIPSVYPLLGTKKIPLGLILSVLHLLMATSFMLYFFHVPDVNIIPIVTVNETKT
ncbi:hypothetical protein AAG570_008370 [Ranatra chinensis]|uniref:Protein YIPF n=1 Tax=Ranatra chinensis TaxID=642074 RepID=A0ABD0Y896_9HEMI